jgi:signal peptidase II
MNIGFGKYPGTKGVFRIALILFLIIVNIGCDQVSKKIVRRNVAPYETISVLNDHVTVMRAENPGAFLSLGESLPSSAKRILLSLLPLAILSFVLYYIMTKHSLSRPVLVGLCFIIGGGIGNVFDRMVYGSVTDFLHIKFGVFQTGIFNLADLSIVTGTIIILWNYFLKKKPTPAT